jgi:hypothetical protein
MDLLVNNQHLSLYTIFFRCFYLNVGGNMRKVFHFRRNGFVLLAEVLVFREGVIEFRGGVTQFPRKVIEKQGLVIRKRL